MIIDRAGAGSRGGTCSVSKHRRGSDSSVHSAKVAWGSSTRRSTAKGTRASRWKTLRHLTASSLVRFKREFRALQGLDHPNVVSLGELISEAGGWFYSMEFIEGVDILNYVRPELAWRSSDVVPSAPPTDALDSLRYVRLPGRASGEGAPLFDEMRLRESLRQLASALAAIHEAGLVHRDIKPSNVIVTAQGRVVLVDFGVVGDVRDDLSTTGGRRMVGTPLYMAPEQAMMATVGPEADMYGFGVVLHEALTGTLPFDGSRLQVLLEKQQHEPPAPATIAPGNPQRPSTPALHGAPALRAQAAPHRHRRARAPLHRRRRAGREGPFASPVAHAAGPVHRPRARAAQPAECFSRHAPRSGRRDGRAGGVGDGQELPRPALHRDARPRGAGPRGRRGALLRT